MTDLDDFDVIRAEICASGSASDGYNLVGMEMDFNAFLGDRASANGPDLWHEMTVRRIEGGEWLIQGRARGRRDDRVAIGDQLARIWDEHLHYGYRSAHAVDVSDDHVALRGVTLIGPGGIWVTARVDIELS